MSFGATQQLQDVSAPPKTLRRRKILRAARRVFSKTGYGGSDLGQIARAAGVGKATLYREFDSKRDLFLAVASDGIEELRDRMVAAVGAPGDPAKVFGEAVRSALAFFDENKDLARVLLLEAGELRGTLVARYFELYQGSKRAADAVFAAYAPAASLKRYAAGELADVLMYLISGRVLVWLLSGQPGCLADDADLILHTYVHGIFSPESGASFEQKAGAATSAGGHPWSEPNTTL